MPLAPSNLRSFSFQAGMSEMEKGEKVLVRAYPNKTLERIFLEEHGSYIVVCRPEIYEQAKITGCEPIETMGFPIEDVIGPKTP